MNEIKRLQQDAIHVRRLILDLAFKSGGGQHLGGGLSMVELMCALYGSALNLTPQSVESPSRDRFILSKGHGVLGFFPVLSHYGYISKDLLYSFKSTGSPLISHPVKNLSLAIESSNGSLGHGLSYASGIAHGLRRTSSNSRVFTLLGDGECNEGSVWEAASFSAHLKLNNLTCIVDFNGLQSDGPASDVSDVASLSHRWSAFGWEVFLIDGHNFTDILSAISQPSDSPKVILARTVKGKGISFMENNNQWHHGRLTESLYEQSLLQLQEQL